MARLLYIGSSKLGYTESELFRMTPRKFFRIYDEYLELSGLSKAKKQGDTYAIDDFWGAF